MAHCQTARPHSLASLLQQATSVFDRASARQRQQWLVSLLILLTLLVGPNGLLTALSTLFPPRPIAAHPSSSSLTPMTLDQALTNQAAAWGHPTLPDIQPPGSYVTGTSPQGIAIPRAVLSAPPVVVAKIPLQASASTTIVTSDQRFSLTIPAGALTSQELAQVGGPVFLQLTRLAGPMGGGASGWVSLGTYRLEVLGPNGLIPGLIFQQPVTFQLHYTLQEALAVVPSTVKMALVSDLSQGAASGHPLAQLAGRPTQEVIAFTAQPTAAPLSGQTLLAPLQASGRATVSITGPSPFAQQPSIENFQNNLNAGALTYQYPFSLPPGPGGFVPPLALNYSSAMVNQSYSLTADAPWVGEGWSLDLGSITWSEENEASGCESFQQQDPNKNDGSMISGGWINCNPVAIGGGACPFTTSVTGTNSVNCANEWANSWTISLNGQSTPLIPQQTNWATGPDETLWSGLYQKPGGPSYNIVSTPQQWYTAPESYAKIIELSCTTHDLTGAAWTHSCWRVWLPTGEMLEFGATDDSVEYGLSQASGIGNFGNSPSTPNFYQYVYSWKLDAMVDPHGNQIHLSYQQYPNYMSYFPPGNSSIVYVPYVQDAELAAISYDSPTCLSTTTICSSGSSAPTLWQPLVQVVFDQGVVPTRFTGGDSACQGWDPNLMGGPGGLQRCDESGNGIQPGAVTNLAVLNALEVQVRPTSGSAWGVLRAYAFSYEQTEASQNLAEAFVGHNLNNASVYLSGELDLTRIQEFGADWTGNGPNTGTSLPPMTFSYLGAPSSSYFSQTGQTGCELNNQNPCSDDSVLQERYLDPLYSSEGPSPDQDLYPPCVPWDTVRPGCDYTAYQETYNQRYLAEVDNGEGMQETFTWQEGHMNVEGVPAGRSVTNPFSCTASDLSTLPCSRADTQHWSRILLVARDTKVQEIIGGATVTVDHHWSYNYAMEAVQSQNNWCAAGDCQAVWDWGNVDDGDFLDFYNPEFRGFQQVQVVEQELDTGGGACTTACTLSVTDHTYITTQGWGVWNQAELDQTTTGSPPLFIGVTCPNAIIYGAWLSPIVTSCPTSPYWASSNMPAGAETQTDLYAPDGTTLLRRTSTAYTLNCAPAGDPTTTPTGYWSDWWTIDPPNNLQHLLVAEPDPENPIAVCDPHVASVQTWQADGGSLSSAPSTTVTYTYDTGQGYSGSHDYGNLTSIDTVASDGGAVGGSGNDIVQTIDYAVNDTFSANGLSSTGTYIVDTPYQKAIRSGSASGPIQALTLLYYDGSTTLTAPPTTGNLWQQLVAVSGTNPYTYLTTTYAYDSYGNLVAEQQPNGQTGACTLTITVNGQPQSQGFSTCSSYDTASYTAHVTQVTNALGQHTSTTFGSGSAFGFGEWAQSATDANSQVTSYQYDVLGRVTGVVAPGEGTGLLTTQYFYSIWCPTTGASTPCSETDTIQRFDSNPPVDTRTFYDGAGQAAETRTPADSSHDVVTYTTYDAREEALFSSRSYYVSAYTGGPGGTASTNAYSAPDSTQPGASVVYDALGRQLQQTDPAGALSTTTYLQLTGPDGATYAGTQVIDANHHQAESLQDALGRTRYTETFTGTSSPYTPYATTGQSYDFQGNLITITHPDGVHTTTLSYDLAGRQLSVSDPDRGTTTDQLDNDGNIVQETNALGQTVYAGYDALDRPLWRNTANTATGAYVTYTYDGSVPAGVSCSGITPGSNAIGHVTTEQFTSGPNNSFSGSYCYGYDARGELLGQVDTLAGTTYLPVLVSYNDAGVMTKLTYPTQEYEQFNFSSQERLTSVTRSARGVTNYLIPSITYNGAAGAAGLPDSYVVGGTGSCASANSSLVCASLSYDTDLRLTNATYTHPTSSTSITYYGLQLHYDAVGNVTRASSTLPAVGGQSGGQDDQQFCYDDLDRLVWAGSTGTNPCTNTSITDSTLTAASYTTSYQLDSSSRITQSTLTGSLASLPQGSYTYDGTHYHAVVGIGSASYTAQYDPKGDMTCRAATSTQTCTSTSQTGATLTYDVEGRLIQWVSANGATTVKYGYDGEGNRFEMQVTSGSTTTTTNYIGDLEEVQKSGSTTAKIVYFYFQGQRVAEDDNAQDWYYPINDALTSTTVVVDFSGVQAVQLFGPYGQMRWAGGTMPTSFAYTGQRADGATGLDYYNARYYDPLAGRFISPDSLITGDLDAYAYAGNNPTTRIDPSGHDWKDFWKGVDNVLDFLFNFSAIRKEFQDASDRTKTPAERTWAFIQLEVNVVLDVTVVGDLAELGIKGVAKGADLLGKALGDEADQTVERTAADVADETGHAHDPSGGGDGHGASNGGNPVAGDDTPQYYFRGTSEGYPGSRAMQLVGRTAVSTDPAIATVFAVKARNFGEGVVHIASSIDLAGVTIGEGNVLKELEAELGVHLTPLEFAQRASISIGVDDARAILARMNIAIPLYVSESTASDVIRELPRLSADQILQFVEEAMSLP